MKLNSWSVALVHGIPQVIPAIDGFVRKACPGVEVINMLHEGILLEILQAGRSTPSAVRRLCTVLTEAESYGVDAVLVTGSALSPAVDVGRKLLSIPVLKIDEAMAETVVTKGRVLGLIATEEATVAPSTAILEAKAREKGCKVEIIARVCPEARPHLRAGRIEEHDRVILDAAVGLEREVDLIILAQASMSSAAAAIRARSRKPVYTSPELAADYLRQTMIGLGWNPEEGTT